MPARPIVSGSIQTSMIGITPTVVVDISWTNTTEAMTLYRVQVGDNLLVIQNTTIQLVVPSSGDGAEFPEVSVTAIDRCGQVSEAGIATLVAAPTLEPNLVMMTGAATMTNPVVMTIMANKG